MYRKSTNSSRHFPFPSIETYQKLFVDCFFLLRGMPINLLVHIEINAVQNVFNERIHFSHIIFDKHHIYKQTAQIIYTRYIHCSHYCRLCCYLFFPLNKKKIRKIKIINNLEVIMSKIVDSQKISQAMIQCTRVCYPFLL